MYRPARFVRNVRVLTFKDVNVEELDKPDLELPDTRAGPDRYPSGLTRPGRTSKTSAAETSVPTAGSGSGATAAGRRGRPWRDRTVACRCPGR